jgi:hypothetical protein
MRDLTLEDIIKCLKKEDIELDVSSTVTTEKFEDEKVTETQTLRSGSLKSQSASINFTLTEEHKSFVTYFDAKKPEEHLRIEKALDSILSFQHHTNPEKKSFDKESVLTIVALLFFIGFAIISLYGIWCIGRDAFMVMSS